MVATGTLNSINPAWLRISMNPSAGNGGTCYGDSSGPNSLGTTDILASTTITGDAICRSTNVTYRLDTSSAWAFLGHNNSLQTPAEIAWSASSRSPSGNENCLNIDQT